MCAAPDYLERNGTPVTPRDLGGGHVPRRVRVFIDYLAERLSPLPYFDSEEGMAGGGLERTGPRGRGA